MATVVASEPAVADSSAVQEKVAAPHKVTIGAPLESCHIPERPALTADQQAKYDQLLEHVKAWKDVPTKEKGTETSPLTDSERMWLTKECLLRYLRATKWHEHEAEKRLRNTLAWRRQFGVDGLTFEHISPELETGKQFIAGYDKEGRAGLYLVPNRQNTHPSHRQVEGLVFNLERVIDIMPAGTEKLALLITFKQFQKSAYTHPGLGIARECLHILQTHYPERLGRALIMHVPWVVWGFFKLITPFIDPLTREKLKFNEDMTQYVPSEHLWAPFGGTMEFEYDHSVYWPALEKLSAERRAEKERRWIAGGKRIGELEDYLRGLLTAGVEPPPVDAPAEEETAKISESSAAASTHASEAPGELATISEEAVVEATVDSKETEEKEVKEVVANETETKEPKPEELKMDELKFN